MNLAIGISSFAKIMEGNYTFIDKTSFIKDLMNEGAEVILLARPHKFGKTLNMSMLYYFLSKHANKSHLFAGLNISREISIMAHAAKYPVIFLSFKNVKHNKLEEAEESIRVDIAEVYSNFKELRNCKEISAEDRQIFEALLHGKATRTNLGISLYLLCKLLYDYHGIKPILLIDNYDSPTHNAYQYNYYDDILSLVQTILGRALKDNEYLGKAVLTGILNVENESIFSGLNNIKACTILSESYKNSFGFTENEVISLLQKAAKEHKLEEVRKWYRGYNFSGVEIYNPWSILNYIEENCLVKPYWVNITSNQLIKDLLTKSTSYSFGEKLQQLMLGKKVRISFKENFAFRNLLEPGFKDRSIWSLLLYTGYLNVENIDLSSDIVEGDVWIVNYEIANMYDNIFKDYLVNKIDTDYKLVAEDLVKARFEDFTAKLRKFLLDNAIYSDFVSEGYYHCLVLGLFVVLKDKYYIKFKRDYSQGLANLILVSKKYDEAFLIEFRFAKEPVDLEEVVQKGLEHIMENQHNFIFKDYPFIKMLIKACLAFSEKDIFHSSEIELLDYDRT